MTQSTGFLKLVAAATVGFAFLAPSASAGEGDVVFAAAAMSKNVKIGTYGTAQWFGTSTGVELTPQVKEALKGTGVIYAQLEGIKHANEALSVELYLTEGWDYAAANMPDVSYLNYFGSYAYARHLHDGGPSRSDRTLEINDFKEEVTVDGKKQTLAEGKARSFLKDSAGANKKVALLLIVRGQSTFEFSQLRISTVKPVAPDPGRAQKAGP